MQKASGMTEMTEEIINLAKEENKQVLVRTIEDIKSAAKQAIENGADWWQFHEHTDNTQ